jgi:hypothetical protein
MCASVAERGQPQSPLTLIGKGGRGHIARARARATLNLGIDPTGSYLNTDLEAGFGSHVLLLVGAVNFNSHPPATHLLRKFHFLEVHKAELPPGDPVFQHVSLWGTEHTISITLSSFASLFLHSIISLLFFLPFI